MGPCYWQCSNTTEGHASLIAKYLPVKLKTALPIGIGVYFKLHNLHLGTNTSQLCKIEMQIIKSKMNRGVVRM